MTDRPIIFSGPMVRALLDGRKTQTRRLATSPLRRCEVDDRLYVRESFAKCGSYERYVATDAISDLRKKVPAIHMPRWASRLTLIVEGVKVQPLLALDWDDAVAEGLACLSKDGGRTYKYGIPDRDGLPGTDDDGWPWVEWRNHPAVAYRYLWAQLHDKPGQRWDDNPNVVALTFRVVPENIDRLAA